VNGIGGSDEMEDAGCQRRDIAHYENFLTVAENPLDVKRGMVGRRGIRRIGKVRGEFVQASQS